MKHAHNFDDITGRRFGRLTVLGFDGTNDSGNAMWRVRCDCGTEYSVLGSNLKSGAARSCGCLRRDIRKAERRREAAGAALLFG